MEKMKMIVNIFVYLYMFGLSIKNFYYLLNLSFVLLYVLYYANFWNRSHKYLDILNEIYAIFIGIVLVALDLSS